MENSIKALGKLRDSIINKRMTEKQLRVLMNKLKEDNAYLNDDPSDDLIDTTPPTIDF